MKEGKKEGEKEGRTKEREEFTTEAERDGGEICYSLYWATYSLFESLYELFNHFKSVILPVKWEIYIFHIAILDIKIA